MSVNQSSPTFPLGIAARLYRDSPRPNLVGRHCRTLAHANAYAPGVPDFCVEPDRDAASFEARLVRLSKVPKQGSWFDLGDGTPAQVKDVRIIGGEPVIFARLGSDDYRRRLKS